MATKPTSKTQDYNKQKLAKDLDRLVKKVSQRGIYVVQKNQFGLFDIINYLTRKAELTDIPTMHIASKIRDRMNSTKKYAWFRRREIQHYLNSYSKLHSDCIHYLHTIDNSKSEITVEVAVTRKQVAEAAMSHIITELQSII